VTADPSLAVVLVNWNRSQDTLNCVQSLSTSTFKDFVVIVVDNGSVAHELEKIRAGVDRFVLIETGENLGYTGGNNVGIRHALKLGCRFVLLLNNDTFVAPSTLDHMMNAVAADSRIGVLTPKIFFHPERHLIWSAGTRFDRRYMIGHLSGYNEQDCGQFDEPADLEWASGCAMLIHSEVIRDVGFLCDDYFAVCEDIDYSLRTKKVGYKIKYQPSALVWHLESASSGGHDAPQYVYYQVRNYLMLHARWASGVTHLVVSQVYFLLYATKRAFGFAFRGKWRSVAGIAYGIRDALIGRVGRCEYAVLGRR
jgi:GT2 family glycosyltransferase